MRRAHAAIMHGALIMLTAVALDRLLGEPGRGHPLAGFGQLAAWLEARLNNGRSRLRGILALVLAVVPLTLVSAWLVQLPTLGIIVEITLLYLVIAPRSLAQHAEAVLDALQLDNLNAARQRVGYMVSRDTAQMDEVDIARSTIESVLENGNDAVFGALFWYLVAGIPGAVCYRLVNTLDAMWGYRTERYQHFGWAAARLDDLLNYIPARLTALSYAIVGNFSNALHCWRQQGHLHDSPNGGPVMAAGAGALGLQLGGAAVYHGQLKSRPILGRGNLPGTDDISTAVSLVQRAVWLWLAVVVIGGVIDA